jgi:SRSO17 transposase
MQADNKNMERMVEVVPDAEWQSLQNFLSHSPWGERGLLDQLARDANHLIGGDTDSCFIVYESAFDKKGNKSVGVSRQWNGRLGKIDNCQIGIYGALCCRDQAVLIDTRLFLPESWTNDFMAMIPNFYGNSVKSFTPAISFPPLAAFHR